MRLLPLLFLCTIGYSQTNYKSLASEYFYQDLSSSFEWIERDIIFSDKTIVVKSYGSDAIDIQTWKIQSIEGYHIEPTPVLVYYTYLESGEEYEYPATFTIIHELKGNVEQITFEIPPNSQIII